MPETTSIHDNSSQYSPIPLTENDLQSKPGTAKTQQRTMSRLPSIQTNQPKPQKKKVTFEPPVSDRESWWRVTIKDTPNPGSYETHLNTFIKEVLARPMTYGFKNDGRRRDPQPLEPKGKDLLPGAYSVEDFADRMNRLKISYGFKGPQREQLLKKTMSTNPDKHIDVAPGLYETQKYQTINAPIEPAKHSFFKSKTRRRIFLPKIGPAPGEYEPQTKIVNTSTPAIISSFRSRTDRFHKKSLNVPGPGTYDKLTVFPKIKQIDRYSTRGVYFNADFSPTASIVF